MPAPERTASSTPVLTVLVLVAPGGLLLARRATDR